jgi:hypothetical protein
MAPDRTASVQGEDAAAPVEGGTGNDLRCRLAAGVGEEDLGIASLDDRPELPVADPLVGNRKAITTRSSGKASRLSCTLHHTHRAAGIGVLGAYVDSSLGPRRRCPTTEARSRPASVSAWVEPWPFVLGLVTWSSPR